MILSLLLPLFQYSPFPYLFHAFGIGGIGGGSFGSGGSRSPFYGSTVPNYYHGGTNSGGAAGMHYKLKRSYNSQPAAVLVPSTEMESESEMESGESIEESLEYKVWEAVFYDQFLNNNDNTNNNNDGNNNNSNDPSSTTATTSTTTPAITTPTPKIIYHNPEDNFEKHWYEETHPKNHYLTVNSKSIYDAASHPRAFAVLREAIIRIKGGYVHADLGLLKEAPCGAARGIGFVRDTFTECQIKCYPGANGEKRKWRKVLFGNDDGYDYDEFLDEDERGRRIIDGDEDDDDDDDDEYDDDDENDKDNDNDDYHDNDHKRNVEAVKTYLKEDMPPPPGWNASGYNTNMYSNPLAIPLTLDVQAKSKQLYRQEEVLIRVPIELQMTRAVALYTLVPLMPPETLKYAPLHELDDALLLALLLAHERGRGRESRYLPYIATLPLNPGCGYSPILRADSLDTIAAMAIRAKMDVNGWPGEITKASEMGERMAEALANDYGPFLTIPAGVSAFATIQWSLCQVSSRAMAGSEEYGALRLVPMVDMINHDASAARIVELDGMESISSIPFRKPSSRREYISRMYRKWSSFVDSEESDAGSFVIRSVRHGRRKPLKKGQELLINYNVPNYSPLDWFINMGFVPPERSGNWKKIDGALPRVKNMDNVAGGRGGGKVFPNMG